MRREVSSLADDGPVTGLPRDPHAFPVLNETQLTLLGRYGRFQRYPADAFLFREGERHVPMFVILSGVTEAIKASADGPVRLGRHGPGEFTGEVETLGGRAAVAAARAVSDCEVLVIDEPALRDLVVCEAELGEIIMRAFVLRRRSVSRWEDGGLLVVGRSGCPGTLEVRQFLRRNGRPFAYLDLNEHAEAARFLESHSLSEADIPAVIPPQGDVLKRPTPRALSDAIGLSSDTLDGSHFDVVVVGAGPAGLAAAVYAASEGLKVAVLDARAPGGQAGASSKIENYFGFPTGISGEALAGRGLSQCRKFGAEVAVPVEVQRLRCDSGEAFVLDLDHGEQVGARSIVIATGARYRKPDLARLEHFEGRGVYYGAAFAEASLCAGQEVIVVGGGNSAGQAAVFLAGSARHVHVLVRGRGLRASMSAYLIRRIEASENITLHTQTELVELRGDTALESVVWRKSGVIEHRPVPHVFLFLGAIPSSAWVADCVALDESGFVLTGSEAVPATNDSRRPGAFETSMPGVFAVGDVRAGSVKRVAAAVGEGSAVIQAVHQYLAREPLRNRRSAA